MAKEKFWKLWHAEVGLDAIIRQDQLRGRCGTTIDGLLQFTRELLAESQHWRIHQILDCKVVSSIWRRVGQNVGGNLCIDQVSQLAGQSEERERLDGGGRSSASSKLLFQLVTSLRETPQPSSQCHIVLSRVLLACGRYSGVSCTVQQGRAQLVGEVQY